jgi:hypothetical protein
MEEINQSTGRRRLVAVHLRPKENFEGAATKLHLVDFTAGQGTTGHFNFDAFAPETFKVFDQIGMPDSRWINIGHVTPLPIPKEFLRSLSLDGEWKVQKNERVEKIAHELFHGCEDSAEPD